MHGPKPGRPDGLPQQQNDSENALAAARGRLKRPSVMM